MTELSRFFQLAILAVVLFLALLASWGIVAHGTPLAWFAAVCAWLLVAGWGAFVVIDIVQDAQIKDAAWTREMKAAGYMRDGRDWIWIDDNRNGRIDPGEVRPRPDIVTIRAAQSDNADAGFRTCRDVLKWCYEQEEAGLSWGQELGHDRFGQSGYEYAMAVFKSMELVSGRRKGVQGELYYDKHTDALERLRLQWQDGGGYV